MRSHDVPVGEPGPLQSPAATVLPLAPATLPSLAAPPNAVTVATMVVALPSPESGIPREAVAVLVAPTAFACLQCQLVGRRRLTCSKADACAELPHAFYLGPVLLLAWAATAAAFIIAVL